MAIAHDASSSTTGSSVSSLTFSHTCSGSDRILMVATSVFDDTSQAERTVASVTYNGVSMTRIDRQDAGNIAAELWYLIAPATGANNVVVTLGATNPFAIAGASSYTGVAQTSPVEANAKASGWSQTATVNVTTIANNSMVVDSTSKYDTTEALSVGADQTSNHNTSVGSGYGIRGASSREAKAAAGSVTMSWTWTTTNRDWAIVAASIKEATTVANTTNFFAIM